VTGLNFRLGVLLDVAAERAACIHLVGGKSASGITAYVTDVAGVRFDAFAGLFSSHGELLPSFSPLT
jgi:hypothetical protein